MSTEALEQETTEIESEVVETAAAPDDDAAFEAGFAEASGQEPEAKESEPEPEPEPEPTPEPEPQRFFGYTEDEIKGMFAKVQEVDRLKEREAKIFGTLGSLKQAIEARREQPTATAKITKESLKRLSAEFPEMAEMLSQDLSEIAVGGQPAFDPTEVERIVESRVDRVTKAQEAKLLTEMHRDWETVVQEPEFATWKANLQEEDRQILDHGWDALKIGERLTAFKEWKSKAAQTKVSNQRRLEAAVTPRTTARSAPVMTEDDAFLQGFNQARGIK